MTALPFADVTPLFSGSKKVTHVNISKVIILLHLYKLDYFVLKWKDTHIILTGTELFIYYKDTLKSMKS